MGGSCSQFADRMEHTDHLGDFNDADWKTRRCAFVILAYSETLVGNVFGEDYLRMLKKTLGEGGKFLRRNKILSDQSDLALFCSVPLFLPEFLVVKEDENLGESVSFDGGIEVYEMEDCQQGEQFYTRYNTLAALSKILKDGLVGSITTNAFPQQSLRALIPGNKIKLEVARMRCPVRLTYVGKHKPLSHVFINYTDQSNYADTVHWESIMQRRAFLVAWALFPVIPQAEPIFRKPSGVWFSI